MSMHSVQAMSPSGFRPYTFSIGVGLLCLGPQYAFAYDGVCTTPQDVVELPAGHWCEVSNSHLRDAEKKPDEWTDWDGSSSASYDSYQRMNGVEAVINNWSGGAYDSRRDRLLIMGGGHNGYGGNEVYAFELDTLQWTRLTDPTAFPSRCVGTNPDNTPVSRHTYGGLSYLENVDKFFVLGGALDCENGGAGAPGTWLLDLRAREAASTYTTTQWGLGSSEGEPPTKAEDDALYDPVTGRVYYQYGSSPSGWASYDPVADTWTKHSDMGVNSGATAVVPGTRRFIVHFGGGVADGYVKWGELGRPSLEKTIVTTTGAKNMESASNPGAAYDWQSDRIVSWSGGTDVFALNVDSSVWQRHPAAAGNLANPGAQDAVGGTYGRFAYAKSMNVFVVVDSVDENVFIYRFAPGAGIQPEAIPEAPWLDVE